MIDQINEIIRCQAIVDWHQHGADLRHRIKRFELRMSVRRDVSHAIVLAHAEFLQSRPPTIATIEELRVSQPQIASNAGFAFSTSLARATREAERRQRRSQ